MTHQLARALRGATAALAVVVAAAALATAPAGAIGRPRSVGIVVTRVSCADSTHCAGLVTQYEQGLGSVLAVWQETGQRTWTQVQVLANRVHLNSLSCPRPGWCMFVGVHGAAAAALGSPTSCHVVA